MRFKSLFAAEVDTSCSCQGVTALIRSEVNHPLSQVSPVNQSLMMVSLLPKLADGLSRFIIMNQLRVEFFFFFLQSCSDGQLFPVDSLVLSFFKGAIHKKYKKKTHYPQK